MPAASPVALRHPTPRLRARRNFLLIIKGHSAFEAAHEHDQGHTLCAREAGLDACGENLAPASAHSMLLTVSLSDGSNCGDYALSCDNAACIRIPAGADGASRQWRGIRAC